METQHFPRKFIITTFSRREINGDGLRSTKREAMMGEEGISK
jgi:hypothetical protein